MALIEKPSPSFTAHLEAIQSGKVTGTNIIGIRKLLNGAARREAGLSIGMSTPKGTMAQADQLVSALHKHHPTVIGKWHDSGLKVLRNPRYAKRWTPEQALTIKTACRFDLVDYEWLGRFHTVPVFRVIGRDGVPFDFRNVPWQSGGDGPEVVA